MRRTFAGMTLIELLASVTIMGMVTVFAIPSFRGLQGRQDMRVAQGNLQSALYRLDQLALAPPALVQSGGTDFDVVGYGLVLYSFPKTNKTGLAVLPNGLGKCSVSATNDFIAVYKFVRFKNANSDIVPFLAPVDPGSTAATPCALASRKYPQDIYVLPARVVFSQTGSVPKLNQPWLISQSLASVGTGVGALVVSGMQDVFSLSATPSLVIRHKTIKQEGAPLCYGVALSRYSEAIQIKSQVKQGCVNE